MTDRGVLDGADDIFFLTWDEWDPARRGVAGFDVKVAVSQRREEYEANQRLSPPPVVVGDWGPEEAPFAPDGTGERTFAGIGVCPGVVRGPARVLTSPEADDRVLDGEVLVAPTTDPGWTPYLLPAAGIIVDMGGMLSHGSIIAREYGIPAVVNVGPASKVIRTGQIVEVDGTNGRARVVDEEGRLEADQARE